MAGRPPKTLKAHVLENSFRARRHYPLLAGAELPWPGFALLQARYRAATSHAERRAIAVEFQTAVTLAHQAASDRSTTDEAGRYPERCPEGSEGVDDGRSRSSRSEDALSHHPHTKSQSPRPSFLGARAPRVSRAGRRLACATPTRAETVVTTESPIGEGSV